MEPHAHLLARGDQRAQVARIANLGTAGEKIGFGRDVLDRRFEGAGAPCATIARTRSLRLSRV